MTKEKKVKILIVAALFIIESIVWANSGYLPSPSVGIIGGADGPTVIYIAGSHGEDSNSDDSIGKKDSNHPNDQEDTLNENKTRERLEQLKKDQENGYLILVNKTHPIDQDYKPDDLKQMEYFVKDRSEVTRYMRAVAADAFADLVNGAASDGIVLKMTTAYRSYSFQKMLFDNYAQKEGEVAANQYSARPGQSEHQTGLAVDISSPSVDYQLTEEYGNTLEGKWLANHCYEYGFILRFPNGKEDITGYQYEPWHIRYVGLTAAKEIYEQNITLEEYLQQLHLDENN